MAVQCYKLSAFNLTQLIGKAVDPAPRAELLKGIPSMARLKERSFGHVLRERRRQLDLTQEEVAHRIKTSTPYIGHLESGKRHPSDKIVTRLAEVLGLDRRELFFLANPRAQAILSPEPESDATSAWEGFRTNDQLRRIHNISGDEMEMLSRVALLGDVRSPRDFIYILNTVRHAVGR
jgi:transcriptional regulator with XRE-family HTH domain